MTYVKLTRFLCVKLSTHNICFGEEIRKNTVQSHTIIWSFVRKFWYLLHLKPIRKHACMAVQQARSTNVGLSLYL